MEPADLERVLRDVTAAAPDVVMAVYLYGSRARGTAGPRSDVDLAVLFRETPPPTLHGPLRDLEAAAERALALPVHAIALDTAPADLVHRVLRDGVIVLDRDRARRLRFEVRSRNEYFDLAQLRRVYRRLA